PTSPPPSTTLFRSSRIRPPAAGSPVRHHSDGGRSADEGHQPAAAPATSLGPADQPSDPDGGADVLLEGAPVSGSRAEGQGRGDVPAGAGRLPGVHRGATRPAAHEELVT